MPGLTARLCDLGYHGGTMVGRRRPATAAFQSCAAVSPRAGTLPPIIARSEELAVRQVLTAAAEATPPSPPMATKPPPVEG